MDTWSRLGRGVLAALGYAGYDKFQPTLFRLFTLFTLFRRIEAIEAYRIANGSKNTNIDFTIHKFGLY